MSDDHAATQADEQQPKRLFGAAAEAAARKARENSLESFMESLAESIGHRLSEAKERVDTKRAELQEAVGNLAKLEAISRAARGLPADEAKPRRRSAPSAPRASRADGEETRQHILNVLREEGGDGLPVASIINKIAGPEDRDGAYQKIRNQLSFLTRKDIVVRHPSGLYAIKQ